MRLVGYVISILHSSTHILKVECWLGCLCSRIKFKMNEWEMSSPMMMIYEHEFWQWVNHLWLNNIVVNYRMMVWPDFILLWKFMECGWLSYKKSPGRSLWVLPNALVHQKHTFLLLYVITFLNHILTHFCEHRRQLVSSRMLSLSGVKFLELLRKLIADQNLYIPMSYDYLPISGFGVKLSPLGGRRYSLFSSSKSSGQSCQPPCTSPREVLSWSYIFKIRSK